MVERCRAGCAPMTPWQPTPALLRSVAVAVVLIVIALIWRRPDLLVIAAPFAIVTAWSSLNRPTTVADARRFRWASDAA